MTEAGGCTTRPGAKIPSVAAGPFCRVVSSRPHTHSTEMHRRGVPEAQIETAAGHRGEGTNKKNYRHLRPEYLRGWIDAAEDFWSGLDKLTTAHRREARRASVIDLAWSGR